MKYYYNKLINSSNTKNFSWLFADQFLRIIASILISSLVARKLGVNDYGILSFFIVFISFFHQITGLSYESQIISNVIRFPEKENAYWGTYFYIRIIFSLLLIVVSIFLYKLLKYQNPKISDLIYLIGSLSILFRSFNIFELCFQAKELQFIAIKSRFISFVVINSVKIFVIFLYPNIFIFILIFTLDIFLNSFFVFTSYKQRFNVNHWVFSNKLCIKILSNSFPLLVSSIMIFLYTKIDLFFVKSLLSEHDLGIYTVVLNISSFLPIIPMIGYNIFLPVASLKKKNNEIEYVFFLRKLFRYFFIVGLIFSFFVFLFSNYFVTILYGKFYTDAISILKIHVFTNLFICLGVVQNIWLTIENKGYILLIKSVIGFLISIFLNFIFLKQYGLLASAYIAIFVQLISSVLINYFLCPDIFKMQINALLFLK